MSVVLKTYNLLVILSRLDRTDLCQNWKVKVSRISKDQLLQMLYN